ncbi:MAG: aminotransferase class III-fold pyridoxal phosphate-dependent enzyme [Planctomycetota bacterium]
MNAENSPLQPSEILETRRRHFGRGLSLSYRDPLTIVRGRGQYLYDESDQEYLDCVNNVCHVGHSHPEVVRAAAEQWSSLNTNTRYLHPELSAYVEELTSLFAAPLSVCYLTCTGSEATDLALRLARNFTGSEAVIALESGYHRNTRAAIDVSQYKFGGRGGRGQPSTTHVVPLPCAYRGLYRGKDVGSKYASHTREFADQIASQGGKPTFLAESILGCGGQVTLPDHFLAESYEVIRKHGGVCIADEVQVGFGRAGHEFWAFERYGVRPDIVVLGKPIGNGHPLAAVVTTAEISEAFDNGMEYFNTFGGNPVSCAVGRAVLRVLRDEGLQEHARNVGDRLLNSLRELESKHALIGEVRGRGLFIGIELVRDRESLEPADRECSEVVERMRNRRILLSVDGPYHNVIKFKPPLPFSISDAERLVQELDDVLSNFAS